MKRHGGNLNVYYWVKEASLKVYGSKCMTSWKRQNYGDSKISDQQWVFAGIGEVGRDE